MERKPTNYVLFSVIAAAVAGIAIFSNNFYEPQTSTEDELSQKLSERVIEPSYSTILPQTISTKVQTKNVESVSSTFEPTVLKNTFSLNSQEANSMFNPAYGISSTQTSLSQICWTFGGTAETSGIGSRPHIDSADSVYFAGNFRLGSLYPGPDGILETSDDFVGFTVPPAQNPSRSGPEIADLAGASSTVWISGQLKGISEIDFSGVVRTTTYNFPADTVPFKIDVDSSGKVFYSDKRVEKVGRLDPSSETITEWSLPITDFLIDNVSIDDFDNVYFGASNLAVPGDLLIKLEKGTDGILGTADDTITKWSFPGGIRSMDVDSSGNVFLEIDKIPKTIGRLDPNTNILTEWSIGSVEHISIDSSDNVFFTTGGPNGGISRLVPSTSILTDWTTTLRGLSAHDSLGNAYFFEVNPPIDFAKLCKLS